MSGQGRRNGYSERLRNALTNSGGKYPMNGLPGLIQLNQWKVDEQRRKVTELEILSDRLSE
jgi:hypothetical protein